MVLTQKDDLMRRCFELARKGYGFVNPNPMVGCVIVKNGKIIAEGYHQMYGEAHAEIHALRKAGGRAQGATIYVNLEPCVHFGKTPPCVDAIMKAKIRGVVAAIKDPNKVVAGKGFGRLRGAGIRVETGVLQQEAEKLNEKFFTFMKTGLPFVGVKIAQTIDGKIADSHGRSKWITSLQSRQETHRLRAGYDAVLIGAATVAHDNPQLNVRLVGGRNPVRIIVDGKLSASPNATVFNVKIAPTIVFTSSRSFRRSQRIVDRLESRGVQVIPISDGITLDVRRILKHLAALGVTSVLVEGGSKTVASFMQSQLVHKIHCFVAPKILGAGLSAFSLEKPIMLGEAIELVRTSFRSLGPDWVLEGYPLFS